MTTNKLNVWLIEENGKIRNRLYKTANDAASDVSSSWPESMGLTGHVNPTNFIKATLSWTGKEAKGLRGIFAQMMNGLKWKRLVS